MGWVVEVEKFKAKIFLAIEAKNLGEGVLRPNGRLDIKAKKTVRGGIKAKWEVGH